MKQKIINLLKKIFTKHEFVVCSRNFTTNDKYGLYWRIAHKYNIEQILKDNPNLTIQGEQGDTKVQSNKYDIKVPKFWVFNIIDHVKGYQYNYQEMEAFCKKHNLNTVPLINPKGSNNGISFKLSDLGSTVQDLVEFSKGKSVLADIPREGIVVRCIQNGKKIFSFKVINPDFLIKYN
jgi:ATP-dependent RNA circularization protein (DNA/RNA ligase family)